MNTTQHGDDFYTVQVFVSFKFDGSLPYRRFIESLFQIKL
jgi:hypothetical protein